MLMCNHIEGRNEEKKEASLCCSSLILSMCIYVCAVFSASNVSLYMMKKKMFNVSLCHMKKDARERNGERRVKICDSSILFLFYLLLRCEV